MVIRMVFPLHYWWFTVAPSLETTFFTKRRSISLSMLCFVLSLRRDVHVVYPSSVYRQVEDKEDDLLCWPPERDDLANIATTLLPVSASSAPSTPSTPSVEATGTPQKKCNHNSDVTSAGGLRQLASAFPNKWRAGQLYGVYRSIVGNITIFNIVLFFIYTR